MAKRLRMTSADYVAIAISPALIMTLVGSLVFYLIAVFYEGEYQIRLTYAFAWFVFAAVLIARIAIEMGSERAAMFALPLAGAMYLFLIKFVEHPSPFSHLINLALMGVVWWCAHRLTWDSTVIDDDEDASGEGLMQRIGVDGPEAGGAERKPSQSAARGPSANELFESVDTEDGSAGWQRLKRLFWPGKGPHTPGQSVLYFSLAALPLFGVGQYWIPVTDTWRRRYAFFLLLVYVASALSLLVTTSFLNLRRYLRQRHVEMPLPIAGTWVGVGAVLIAIVMILAMLVPRPAAEIAISRPPWQVGSPGAMSASRLAVNRDGGEQQGDDQNATAGERTAEEGQGDIDKRGGKVDPNSSADGNKESDSGKQGKSGSQDGKAETSGKQGEDRNGTPSDGSQQQANGKAGKRNENDKGNKSERHSQQQAGKKGGEQRQASGKKNDGKGQPSEKPSGNQKLRAPSPSAHPPNPIQNIASSLGGLAGVLKVLFYAALAIIVAVLVWKYREQILRAIADIMRALRELFGGSRSSEAADREAAAVAVRPKSFGEFQDPFLTGQATRLAPEELVRYTFAAFEAWANDRGRPRSPDCTPQELIGAAVDPDSPLYAEARQLVRMYGEVAYASRRVSLETANRLREVWQLMRETHAVAVADAV